MTGFVSKRQAAQAKLDDDDAQGYVAEYEAALLTAYQSGFADGKKAPQPEQEVSCRFCHDKRGCWTWQCYSCGEIDDVQQPPPAAQPEQEPTGYWDGKFSKDGGATLYEVPQESMFGRKYPNIPLYTTPPAAQRPWQGLTEWEREAIAHACGAMGSEWLVFIEAVEKALKEKNR
jgi:hypothetical protein